MLVRNLTILAILLLFSSESGAERASGLTLNLPTARTIETQRKVDRLYEAGKFDRAFFLYRNELAPIGDKYAQYMVGFMYLSGTGIPENYPMALAWYRLAAEQGTTEFVAVRRAVGR